MPLLAVVVAALVVGAAVYSLLVVVAAIRYLAVRPAPGATTPVSVLKPLAGAEEALEDNLRSFFLQDYPAFEILFAVREAADPAAAVVKRLQAEYAGVAARLIVTGEPPYPNAKVFALEQMLAAARHELVVMSDSDIRVGPDLLRTIAAEFSDPQLGLATCPYRAVPGRGVWSTLEAVGLNTEFLAGVLVARLVEGMRFAVGPTIAARRAALDAIGGMQRVKDYLAEDFMLGKLVAESGWGVILSSYIIEHHIGGGGWCANLRHRLRWVRSTRRSRPAGYVGQLFTYPLPLAAILAAVAPGWWPLAAAAAAARVAAAWFVAGRILADPLPARCWWLLPVQDCISFIFWGGGCFGNTIEWRGRRYYLHRDGRFSLR
jgi:ceramide glucosyltransferase